MFMRMRIQGLRMGACRDVSDWHFVWEALNCKCCRVTLNRSCQEFSTSAE